MRPLFLPWWTCHDVPATVIVCFGTCSESAELRGVNSNLWNKVWRSHVLKIPTFISWSWAGVHEWLLNVSRFDNATLSAWRVLRRATLSRLVTHVQTTESHCWAFALVVPRLKPSCTCKASVLLSCISSPYDPLSCFYFQISGITGRNYLPHLAWLPRSLIPLTSLNPMLRKADGR